MVRISTKTIKVTAKSKSSKEQPNTRKKHRSHADAVSIYRSKQLLRDPSKVVFEMENPEEKIVTRRKKKERRNSDGAIGTSHHKV